MFIGCCGLNTAYTANSALIPDIVDHESTGTASGIVATHLLVGSITSFIPQILMPNWSIHIMYIEFLVAGVVTVCLVCYVTDEEISSLPEGEEVSHQRSLSAVNHGIENLFTKIEYRDFLKVIVSRCYYYFGVGVSSFLFFFLRDGLDISSNEARNNWVSWIVIAGEITGMCFAAPLGMLSDRG